MEKLRKLNWRWLMMLFALFMMGATMTACGDDDDDDDDSSYGAYVGVWASLDDIEDGYDQPFAIKLSGDHKGVDGYWDTDARKFVGTSDAWSWSVNGDVITVMDADGESDGSFRFVLSADQKTATQYDGEDMCRYVRMQ